MKSATKIYTDGNIFECHVVNYHNYYEVVFPTEFTLKSKQFNSAPELHNWLDRQYGKGLWVLK